MPIRYLTAGESHGYALNAVIDGIPAGVALSKKDIDTDLARRQAGFGRGGRMLIEHDEATIVSGVRDGRTTGSPISLLIRNKDWENWKKKTALELRETKPRPGHADLAGALKFGLDDVRSVLERASARETAVRTAAGSVARKVLSALDIRLYSTVTCIGGVLSPVKDYQALKKNYSSVENSDLRCADKAASLKMKKRIEAAVKNKDSVGGIFEVIIGNVPPGIGSFTQSDLKLDAALASAVMSIQAVKGVEFGMGFSMASRPGKEVHDEIFYSAQKGFFHKTNNAGGLEGGMSNGEDIVIRAVMKPIPTLMQPLRTVELGSHKSVVAFKERSDVCAVPAAGVVAESVCAIEVLKFIQMKFGGDTLQELISGLARYRKAVRQ